MKAYQSWSVSVNWFEALLELSLEFNTKSSHHVKSQKEGELSVETSILSKSSLETL